MIADSIFEGSTNTVEFVVPGDGDVQLYTISLVDTYGVVYNAAGDVVAENDNGTNGDDFYIDVFLVEGTYSIEISVTGSFDYADYELYYDYTGEDLTVYEPITVDSFVAGLFDTYGEVAYFELTVTETVTVNIYTTSDFDIDGYIFASKTASVPFDYNVDISDDNWNFSIDNLTLEPGNYYLEVEAFPSEWDSPNYELHVDTVQ